MIDIPSTIRETLSEQLNVKLDQVVDDALLVKDLDLDSMDVVELTIKLEEIFDIDIYEEALPHMKQVKDVIRYIEVNYDPELAAL